MKHFKLAGAVSALALVTSLGAVSDAQADTLTPDIIWGSGNTNQGFTVVTDGSLELGLRAKRRYPRNDAIGVGIVQDVDGNYRFDSSESTAGAGKAMWSYDWGINSSFDGTGGAIGSFNYQISLDTDPTINSQFTINYDPLSATSTGYYLGTNTTSNGAATFTSVTDINNGNTGDLTVNNVAQNSVQPHWVGGPIGSGQFTVRLSAFDSNTDQLVSSVSINAIVDSPAPIPVPAALPLLLAGLGGLGLVARRKRKAT